LNATPIDLAVFDDEKGSALYAGGYFTTAGDAPARAIAKWDGTTWSSLGEGMGGSVRSLAVFDDGTGPALYAAGFFLTAGGIPTNRIAKWDGTSWSALGNGLDWPVHALVAFDDGTGNALFAGGGWTQPEEFLPRDPNIAKWYRPSPPCPAE
jgi:hypothetical protein